MRKLSIKYFVLSILGIVIFAYYILHTTYYLPPTLAQTASCPIQSSDPRVKDGLISASEITSTNFSQEQGICIVDSTRAPFLSLGIPDYDSLKSKYFDQSRVAKTTLSGDQTDGIDLGTDKPYYITGSLALDNPNDITGNKTGVIFVDGNLTIGPIPTNQLTHGNNNSGLVFVVKENVLIDKTVTRLDAVIISQGTIYTATNAAATPPVTTCDTSNVIATNPLVINGSLISLNSTKPIKFCRKLTGSNAAAEQIIHQPKYLVILRDIFSDTLQKWAEIP